jgi:hypothetical protein
LGKTPQAGAATLPASIRGDFDLCSGGRPHQWAEDGVTKIGTFNGTIRRLRRDWCTECYRVRVVPLDNDPRYV